MKIQNIFIALFVVFSVGCATNSTDIKMPALTAMGSKVTVVKNYDTSKCTFVTKIIGEAKGYSSGTTVWASAMNDIRNKAAYKKTNLVLMRNYTHSKDSTNALKIRIFGDAFICGHSFQEKPRGYQQRTGGGVGYSDVPPSSKNAPRPDVSGESSSESEDEVHPPVHP